MEAPDKIYVHEISAHELTEKLPYHIEYVRKDKFIDKVSEFIELLYVTDYINVSYPGGDENITL